MPFNEALLPNPNAQARDYSAPLDPSLTHSGWDRKTMFNERYWL